MDHRFPEIETPRLLLTQLKSEDVSTIVHFASDEKISKTTLNLPHPYSEKDAIFWINLANQGFERGTDLIFGIKKRPDLNFIGGIGLRIERNFNRAEIGYWIAVPFWNNGFATEATKAIISYGFQHLNLNKFTSSHFAINPASGKVMSKCGMVQEGELKSHILKGDTYHDLILYGLTKASYNSFNLDS
ncbi:MAG: GNAT family N-acetyltransferase [Bacteroidota bacterium]